MSNVVEFEIPSYIKSKKMVIAKDGCVAATNELHAFLRKTPYAVGVAPPEGCLMIQIENVTLQIGMGIYSHGAFSTIHGMSRKQEELQVEHACIPDMVQSVLFEITKYLRYRGYPLIQIYGIMDIPQMATWHWGWEPSSGYERLYMNVSFPR